MTYGETTSYGSGWHGSILGVHVMGTSQPPPISQVEEILDDIDEAIRELQPEGHPAEPADAPTPSEEDE